MPGPIRFSTSSDSINPKVACNLPLSDQRLQGIDTSSKSRENTCFSGWNTMGTTSSQPAGPWNISDGHSRMHGWNLPPEEIRSLIIRHPNGWQKTIIGTKSRDGKMISYSSSPTTPQLTSSKIQTKTVTFEAANDGAPSALEDIFSPLERIFSRSDISGTPPQSTQPLEQLRHRPGPPLSPILLDVGSNREADGTLHGQFHLGDSLDSTSAWTLVSAFSRTVPSPSLMDVISFMRALEDLDPEQTMLDDDFVRNVSGRRREH